VLLVYRYAIRRPRLVDYAPQRAGPLVSVIVPARNEGDEHRALGPVDPRDRVSIHRGDRGGRPLERHHRRNRRAPGALRRSGRSVAAGPRAELPEGWFGKSWAIVQGYRVARGDLLLFTDADTWHHPELLPRTVTVLTAERVHLVSVVARQEMVSFWEAAGTTARAPRTRVAGGDLRRVNRTRITWDAIASGAYVLTTRRAYDAVGTHEAVKGAIAEDVALAQAYVRHHLDIFLHTLRSS